MARRMVMAFLLLGFAVLGSGPAEAYPIPPRTLWELTGDAELIVLADVEDVKPARPGKDEEELSIPEAIARLQVQEIWKGEAVGQVDVTFPEGLICPAPPRYIEGKSVVAFLARSENGVEKWRTVALSYGTLYPSAAELSDVREMTRRALDLQASGKVPTQDLVDWLVEAASRPGTRWHGLYPLAPDIDEVHSFYDRTDRRPLHQQLQPAHFARLAQSFAEIPPVDITLPMMLTLLARTPGSALDEAAAAAIEAALELDRTPWWLEDALRLTLARFGDQHPERRIEALEKAVSKDCWEMEPAKMRELWEAARRDLKIPQVRPAQLPEVDIWGVAQRTPA